MGTNLFNYQEERVSTTQRSLPMRWRCPVWKSKVGWSLFVSAPYRQTNQIWDAPTTQRFMCVFVCKDSKCSLTNCRWLSQYIHQNVCKRKSKYMRKLQKIHVLYVHDTSMYIKHVHILHMHTYIHKYICICIYMIQTHVFWSALIVCIQFQGL